MKKCDVIIPVYNSAEWVNLCIYALMNNTDMNLLNKIILVDDCSNIETERFLNNIKNKYKDKIILSKNRENLGFVKTVNSGLKQSNADYVLLLNTDCLVADKTIEKLINNMEKDSNIGLMCPISSNAANLTLEMFPGFSYMQMDKLLESKFKEMTFDACTVVGNCLMISRECLNKVGLLDEAYGMGYGEETDYQFKAMKKGFKAKVAIDTYVFHKSEASFGNSPQKQERLKKNRDLFFSRWGNVYYKELNKYEVNDPIKYILSNLTEEDKKISIDSCFYLAGIVQNAGGVHVVVDIVNNLIINGVNANIIYDTMGEYKEIMLFNPIDRKNINKVDLKQIIATIYTSVYIAKQISESRKIPLIYFVQGNETYFENGGVYGITELSYKLADEILTISNYLKKELKDTFGYNSTVIKNTINYNLLNRKNTSKKAKSITLILRNMIMKGDWIALDIIKKLSNRYNNLKINVVYMDPYIEFPNIFNDTIEFNKILGPIKRQDMISLLQNTDIYVDCSLSEGFGLTALEAIAAGAVPVVSNSMGVMEYMKNGVNGFVIKEVNVSDEYVNKIGKLIEEPDCFNKIKENLNDTAKKFDSDNSIKDYISYFERDRKYITRKIKLSKKEQIIVDSMTKTYSQQASSKRKIYYIAKVIPKKIKNRLKKMINFLYSSYDH